MGPFWLEVIYGTEYIRVPKRDPNFGNYHMGDSQNGRLNPKLVRLSLFLLVLLHWESEYSDACRGLCRDCCGDSPDHYPFSTMKFRVGNTHLPSRSTQYIHPVVRIMTGQGC